jgi:hypothetical protein
MLRLLNELTDAMSGRRALSELYRGDDERVATRRTGRRIG